MGSSIDWTQVLVALVAGLPATIAALGSLYLARQLRTPSGDKPGTLIERTHDLAIVNTEITKDVHKRMENGNSTPTTEG